MDKDAQKDFASAHMIVPSYTTSLDAIVGLIESRLGDQAVWHVGTDFGGWVGGHICCHTVGMDRPKNYSAQASTPALALCLCLLSALTPPEAK